MVGTLHHSAQNLTLFSKWSCLQELALSHSNNTSGNSLNSAVREVNNSFQQDIVFILNLDGKRTLMTDGQTDRWGKKKNIIGMKNPHEEFNMVNCSCLD